MLDGKLDIAGADAIDLQFNAVAASHVGVVVDLTNVSALSSIGIRSLLIPAKTVQRRGGSLVLLNPVAEVERVLEVAGMIGLMPIYRDRNAALASLGAKPMPKEIGGPKGPEPTRYGDWEVNGRCTDF